MYFTYLKCSPSIALFCLLFIFLDIFGPLIYDLFLNQKREATLSIHAQLPFAYI